MYPIFYLVKGGYRPNIYPIILQCFPFSLPLSLYIPYKVLYSIYLLKGDYGLLRPSLAQDAMDDPGHVDHLWLTKVYRKTAVHIGVMLG